jgi:aminopeptidase YwaD
MLSGVLHHHELRYRARDHLAALCASPDRRPGGASNEAAVDHVSGVFDAAGWLVEVSEFACLDWESEGAHLRVDDTTVPLAPGPYGRGVSATAPVRVVRTAHDLDRTDLGDCVVVIDGELAREPLTPKNYPFYQSDDHARIVAALEAAQPAAVVAVTGTCPSLCGAVEPFPLIEDGDFEIPAAAIRTDDAGPVLDAEGSPVTVTIDARRVPSRARNGAARLGSEPPQVSIWAHIDTKPGTPGAVDNGGGVVALLTLADLLGGSSPPVGVELLVVNGEDHFAAPGEQHWLAANGDRLDALSLMVNLDAIAYRGGTTAYSLYNADPALTARVGEVFARHRDLIEGPPWHQSDHGIFLMQGRPALALTTEPLDEMMATVVHSVHDTPDQVDLDAVIEVSTALVDLLDTWA